MLDRRRAGVDVDGRQWVGRHRGGEREHERQLVARHPPVADELGERGPHRLARRGDEGPGGRDVFTAGAVGQGPRGGRVGGEAGGGRRQRRRDLRRRLAETHERVAGGVDLGLQRAVAVGEGDHRRADRCPAELDRELALHTVVARRDTDQQVVQPDREVADDRRVAGQVERAFAQRDPLPRGVLPAGHDVGGRERRRDIHDHPVDGRSEAGLTDQERRRVERQLGHRPRRRRSG